MVSTTFSFNPRSTKFLELMDNAEKAIEKVNADQIYTSKQFMRIRDDFYVSFIGKIETRRLTFNPVSVFLTINLWPRLDL